MARQKREGRSQVTVSDAVRRYLFTGTHDGEFEVIILKGRGDDEILWKESRDEFLREFIRGNPGKRPFCWWKYDSPGPRVRVGGRGDLIPSTANLRFGVPLRFDFWDARFASAAKKAVPSLTPKELYDESDPPQYESQAMFLDRNELLGVAEKKMLTPADFAPEAIASTDYWGEK